MAIIGAAEVLITPTSRGFASQLEADLTPSVTGVATKLGGIIAGAISVREVGRFFADTVTAASDTVESINQVGVVFGESADEVERFADSSAALGIAEQQALQAAAGFGGLFAAMKISEEQSAAMSTSLVELAGDLASMKNTSVDEALTALTSGIVGETEPLRRFDVQLNEARIRSEALALGLDVGTGALDAQTKALATYSVIMQDTVLAQGDAIRTGDEFAGQQRKLTAEWAEAKAEIGEGLLPAALEMVQATRGELIPTVVDLASSAVPLLIEGFQAAEPLLGTTTKTIQALAPGLEAVASIVDAIPDPLLEVGAYSWAASRALGAAGGALTNLSTRASDFVAIDLSGRLDDSGAAAARAGSGFGVAALKAGALPLVITAGMIAFEGATRAGREYDALVDELTTALEPVAQGQEDLNVALGDFIELQAKGLGADALRTLSQLGISYSDLTDSILAGGDALDPLREKFESMGIDTIVDVGRLDDVPDALVKVADAADLSAAGLKDLIERGEDWDGIAQDSAESTLLALVNTEDLTQAQLDQALATASAGLEIDNYAGALDLLAGTNEAVAAATGDVADESGRAVGPIGDVTAAMEAEREVAQGVLDSLQEIAAAQLEAYSSTLRYESATNDFSDSLLEYETKTKEAAEAHREFGSSSAAAYAASIDLRDASIDVREASLGQAAAAVQLAEDQATAEGRTLSFNESQRIQREEIQKVAESMAPGSPIRNELLGLAESIDEVEGIHPISVTADTVEAQAKLDTLARTLNDLYRSTGQKIRISEGGGGGLILGAAGGFAGTVNRPTQFLVGEGGESEDVLVVPSSLGGISKVVAELAQAVGGFQGGGDAFGRTTVHQTNTFHIVESNDGRSTAMRVAKRLSGAGFRGGISGLVN